MSAATVAAAGDRPALPERPVELARRSLYTVHAVDPIVVRCIRGALWVVRDRCQSHTVVAAGETETFEAGDRLSIYALDAASIDLRYERVEAVERHRAVAWPRRFLAFGGRT